MASIEANAGRDLMLGVLALRTGRLSREALAAALDASLEGSLGDSLGQRSDASVVDLAMLFEQLDDSWMRHEGDLARILPEMGSVELACEVAELPGNPATRERMMRALEKVYGPMDPFATMNPGTGEAADGDFGTVAGPESAAEAKAEPEAQAEAGASSGTGPDPAATIGPMTEGPDEPPGPDSDALEMTERDPFATRMERLSADLEKTEADPYATRATAATTEVVGSAGGVTERLESRGSWGSGFGVGARPDFDMRFQIVRPHAKGGLGEVFVARDEQLNREVALKEIQARFADHTESQARFRFEAEVTGGLEHPGIVPVYALGHYPDGRPYYAMRFIRGETLKQAIDRFHPEAAGMEPGERELEFRKLIGRFVDVCQALAYAHSRSVIHRDIKPANIMIGPYGETLVVDWGLAKPLDRPVKGVHEEDGVSRPLRPSSGSSISATMDGSAIGTPGFMSPEQAEGKVSQLGPATDIYSLGATLYYLLADQPPFTEKTLPAMLEKVRRNDFPAPRSVKPTVPAPLDAICLKAMARNPEDRYATTLALADDLEHWLADEPVSCYREPWTIRAARWARRHKTLVATGLGMIGVTLVALVVGNVLISREQARTERNYQLARSAVEQMLSEVGSVELVDVPQMEGVRRLLLERRWRSIRPSSRNASGMGL